MSASGDSIPSEAFHALLQYICRRKYVFQACFFRSHASATMEGIIGLTNHALGFTSVSETVSHPSIAAFGLSRLNHRVTERSCHQVD